MEVLSTSVILEEELLVSTRRSGMWKEVGSWKREDGSFCTLAFSSVILEEELLGSTRKEVGSGKRF
jgi:hypothetical protein